MTTTDWTDEKVMRMTALWMEGASANTIARVLGKGVTRSAVLGKLHRMGVRRPAQAVRRRAKPSSARDGSLRTAQRPGPVARRAVRVRAPLVAEPELSALSTLLSVRRGFCRWPCGDPGPAGLPVCGRAVSRGAYCARHAAISYQGRQLPSLFALANVQET